VGSPSSSSALLPSLSSFLFSKLASRYPLSMSIHAYVHTRIRHTHIHIRAHVSAHDGDGPGGLPRVRLSRHKLPCPGVGGVKPSNRGVVARGPVTAIAEGSFHARIPIPPAAVFFSFLHPSLLLPFARSPCSACRPPRALAGGRNRPRPARTPAIARTAHRG